MFVPVFIMPPPQIFSLVVLEKLPLWQQLQIIQLLQPVQYHTHLPEMLFDKYALTKSGRTIWLAIG